MRPATESVLHVEDDDGDALLVRHNLEDAYTVIHVDLLESAIKELRSGKYSAVLLDLGLPDATGASAIEAIRRTSPQMPIIVLTGLDDDEAGSKALRAGAQDYLLKNDITTTSLPRSVRYAIERRRGELLRQQLSHADRLASIGQIAAGVAHEVNNPAAFLLANLTHQLELLTETEGLLADLSSPESLADHSAVGGAPRHQSTLKRLAALVDLKRGITQDNLDGIRRIRTIVRDLGSFSRIDRDQVDWVDMAQVLRSAANLTRNEVRHRAAFHYSTAKVPLIAGHTARLSQVLVNLIVNASQALGDADRNQHSVEARLEHDTEAREIRISVRDTGCGIAPDALHQIFDPFFTTKSNDQGTGIGLSLCRETIRNHGGRIDVTSELGKGSTFTVVLPLDTGLVPALPRSRVGVRPPGPRLSVWLIDDEPALRRALQRTLSSFHDVRTFARAEDALSRLEASDTCDVVLCDLMMPQMDGADFYASIAKRFPNLLPRIVFFSGGAVTPRVQAFIAEMKIQVLDKPAAKDQLLAALRHAADRGR